jgi:hypothetical protein
MKTSKVYIIVQGGMVESVYTDNENIGVCVLDFDATDDEKSRDEQEQMYAAIKKQCIEAEYWYDSEL